MVAPPIVLTAEELATREARNLVMISSEELLHMRTDAYTKSATEISFMFRQPSASAVLVNKPYIQLDLSFNLVLNNAGEVADAGNSPHIPVGQDNNQAYGRMMEGLPFLSKCVRTSVISINGATQTYRNSEYFVPYLRTQVSRAAMSKIGTPWNDFCEQFQYPCETRNNVDARVANRVESEQQQAFKYAATQDYSAPWPQTDLAVSKRFTFVEPLFMSVFGGLAGNDSFPLWSCEQNKSPSLLHCQQCTVNLNLLDNWQQNLFGLIQSNGNAALKVGSVTIDRAALCCTWVQPPPKYIASALSSNVSYASFRALRFRCKPPSGAGMVHPGTKHEFTLDAVSFPYQASTYMFEIAPDYNTKMQLVQITPVNGEYARMSKEDRRWGIVSMDLIINTSPNVCPSAGSANYTPQEIGNLRYNARQLYQLYLKNSSSVEKANYSFQQWFESGCTVLLSPQDMNGILPSQHIRGNISMQGKITAVNTTGYSCWIGDSAPIMPPIHGGHAKYLADGDGALNSVVKWPFIAGDNNGVSSPRLEKFEAQVVAIYSNNYMALDSKSGIVGEGIMSEQFGQSLRLSGAQ